MSELLGKTEEIVKKAKELGADEIVAKTTIGKYRQLRFSRNQVDITVAWNDYTTDLVLAWKKRVVATEMHDFVDVDAALRRLMKLAKVSKESPTFRGFAKGKFHYRRAKPTRIYSR